jgi:amidohydrolase
LGVRDANTKTEDAPSHHKPVFFMDDSKLDVGVKAFCHLVFDFKKSN